MVRVMEEVDVTRPQQLVLLAMAENAEPDGTKCFPSIDRIAWKAGYKPRNVIDIIRELRGLGILEEVTPAMGTRAAEYTIHLDLAPIKPAFEEWQRTNGRHRHVPARGNRHSAPTLLGVQSHETFDQDSDSSAPVVEVQSHETLHSARGAFPREEGCNLTGLGVQSHGLRGAISREEGCNLTGLGVQSHGLRGAISREEGCNLTGLGVQSHVNKSRENAPRPSTGDPKKTSYYVTGGQADLDDAQDSPPDEPDGGDQTDSPPTTTQPFDLFTALCEERGQSPGVFGAAAKGKQLAVAKRLLADGIQPDDVRRIVRWLGGQQWRDSLDMLTVEQNVARWRLAGSPDRSAAAERKRAHNDPRRAGLVF